MFIASNQASRLNGFSMPLIGYFASSAEMSSGCSAQIIKPAALLVRTRVARGQG
jgi:hypothetical protein